MLTIEDKCLTILLKIYLLSNYMGEKFPEDINLLQEVQVNKRNKYFHNYDITKEVTCINSGFKRLL